MKKLLLLIIIAGMAAVAPLEKAHAQLAIAEVIKAGVKKVVKAVDLKIQRLQNETIWLQNAQKAVENTMSQLKLSEISDWVGRQRTLYADYFQELYKVKSLITYYHRIREITGMQVSIVQEYGRAWSIIKQDTHFTTDEITYMEKVYGGILDATVKNIDQLSLVINSFTTQMSDAKRLEMINNCASEVEQNYSDLKQFNSDNAMVSIRRARDLQDAITLKKLYGLTNP
ncbi:conjugal transfer protein TraI [Filimonas effusa]|uniref:Conjugal transfer protein TraI n=1 Tax=Filimonas effusa TaxID=2508721 RepID=A0A4Q1D0N0_9BACT|nr:conjugal transfer protein TraI [Filimonas effusa]RXK81289.1 conjugal transfer protein TraI [Filimonas effusa]